MRPCSVMWRFVNGWSATDVSKQRNVTSEEEDTTLSRNVEIRSFVNAAYRPRITKSSTIKLIFRWFISVFAGWNPHSPCQIVLYKIRNDPATSVLNGWLLIIIRIFFFFPLEFMKICVFWGEKPCMLISYQRFGETCCLRLRARIVLVPWRSRRQVPSNRHGLYNNNVVT